jgi:hypothetical protein
MLPSQHVYHCRVRAHSSISGKVERLYNLEVFVLFFYQDVSIFIYTFLVFLELVSFSISFLHIHFFLIYITLFL